MKNGNKEHHVLLDKNKEIIFDPDENKPQFAKYRILAITLRDKL
jgi:phage anti-repressor protein